MIEAPARLASLSAVSILGWLVPGFWPTTIIRSALVKSSRVTVPLPIPMESPKATPDDSWHMFEQSGRLLVPNLRANSCHRKAASLLVLPEV